MICKKCKKEVNYMLVGLRTFTTFKLVYRKERGLNYTEIDKDSIDGNEWYKCPECYEDIAESEEEAEEMLKKGGE